MEDSQPECYQVGDMTYRMQVDKNSCRIEAYSGGGLAFSEFLKQSTDAMLKLGFTGAETQYQATERKAEHLVATLDDRLDLMVAKAVALAQTAAASDIASIWDTVEERDRQHGAQSDGSLCTTPHDAAVYKDPLSGSYEDQLPPVPALPEHFTAAEGQLGDLPGATTTDADSAFGEKHEHEEKKKRKKNKKNDKLMAPVGTDVQDNVGIPAVLKADMVRPQPDAACADSAPDPLNAPDNNEGKYRRGEQAGLAPSTGTAPLAPVVGSKALQSYGTSVVTAGADADMVSRRCADTAELSELRSVAAKLDEACSEEGPDQEVTLPISKQGKDTSDPDCTCTAPGADSKTKVVDNNMNLEWNHDCVLDQKAARANDHFSSKLESLEQDAGVDLQDEAAATAAALQHVGLHKADPAGYKAIIRQLVQDQQRRAKW